MESHKPWIWTSVRWFAVAVAASLFADPALAQPRPAAKEAARAVQSASPIDAMRSVVVVPDRRPTPDGPKENVGHTAPREPAGRGTRPSDTAGTPPSDRYDSDSARGRRSDSGSRSRDDGGIGRSDGVVITGVVVPRERPPAPVDTSGPIIAGLRAEIVRLTQQIGPLREQVSALGTTNERLNRDLTNERVATAQQLGRLRQDNDGLKHAIDRTNQTIAKQNDELRDLQADKQKAESALRDAIAQRGPREAALQTELNGALADSKNERDQIDALRAQLDRVLRTQWLWVAGTALLGLAVGGVTGRFFKPASANPAVRPMSLRVSAADWWMHVESMVSESLPAFSIRTQLMPVSARMHSRRTTPRDESLFLRRALK